MIGIVIGRVSKEPEEKESKNGNYYCVAALAESDKNEKKATAFYDLVAFDEEVGEAMMKMPKGKLVKIEGDFTCEGRQNKTVKDAIDIKRTLTIYKAENVLLYDNGKKEFVTAAEYEEE